MSALTAQYIVHIVLKCWTVHILTKKVPKMEFEYMNV